MILQRYLYREVLQYFAGVMTVLLLIFVSNRFVRYLSDAAAGELGSNLVLQLMSLKLVESLPLIMPLAYFLAVLMAIGRLYRDSEMTAVAAGGIGAGRFLVAMLWLSLAFAVLVGLVSMYFAPRAAAASSDLKMQSKQGEDITGLVAGRFKAYNDGDRVFYARDISPDLLGMRDLFVHVDNGDDMVVMASAGGYQEYEPSTADRFMVMTDGYRYEGVPGQATYSVTRFDKQAIRIRNNPVTRRHVPNEAVPTAELVHDASASSRAELHWRLGMPVSLVVLGLLAVPLAKASPRQGRYANLFNATLLYVVYSNLLGIARELTTKEVIPYALGAWPVHGLMLLLLAGLMLAQSGLRWRYAAWRASKRSPA